jgi:hypothetical protein
LAHLVRDARQQLDGSPIELRIVGASSGLLTPSADAIPLCGDNM